MSQHFSNANMKENDSIPLLELDFDSDDLYKSTEKNNRSKSPSIICPLYQRKRQSRLAFHPIKNNEKKGM